MEAAAGSSDLYLSDTEMLQELDILEMLCDDETDIRLTQIGNYLKTESDDTMSMLENDDENVQLSQIADQIEKDYHDSEDMFGQFVDFSIFDDIFRADYGNFNMDVDPAPNMAMKNETEDADANRFGNLKTDDDLDELISVTTPKNTKKSTNWAKNVFTEWIHKVTLFLKFTILL